MRRVGVLLQVLLGPLIFVISICSPKKPNLWLFAAWFGEKFDDNPRSLFEFCHLQPDSQVEPYWIYKGARPVHSKIDARYFVHCYSLQGMLLQLRAGVFVLCVNARDFLPFFLTPRSIIVQTWHGTPMKQIGYPVIKANLFSRMKFWIRRFTTDNYKIVVSTSDYTDNIFRQAFQIDETVLWRGAYPRVIDMLVTDSMRRDIRKDIFHVDSEKVWLYLPTHRNEGRDATATTTGYTALFERRDFFEHHGIVILLKPHFYELRHVDDLPRCTSVNVLSDFSSYSLYQLLGAADGLVTDYSSVAFDVQLVSDKIVIFEFDLQQYRAKHRDLITLPSKIFEHVAADAGEVSQLIKAESERSDSRVASTDLLQDMHKLYSHILLLCGQSGR